MQYFQKILWIQKLLPLAKDLGVNFQMISSEQLEDHRLALEIEEGMKTENVSKSEVFKALEKWSSDEFRSTNGQIEWIIQRALHEAKREPKKQNSNNE